MSGVRITLVATLCVGTHYRDAPRRLIPRLYEENADHSRGFYRITLASPVQRFKAFNLGRLIAVDRVPQVPILLQTEPEIGRHSDHPS